jgi:peptidoglycan/LPS O-acetylase OafA/YrhL
VVASDVHRGSLPHNPALDGLRALAALGICAYHAGFAWASGGFLSVSAFFTLSGFLITRLLLLEFRTRETIGLGAFWGRRFRRLLPPALVALAAIVILEALGIGFEPSPSFAGDIVSALLYVANWRFVFEGYDYASIFRDPSPVQHFWSLGIEEQFYLLYPLALLGCLRAARGRRGLLAAFLAIATLGSTLWMAFLYAPGESMLRVYFGSDTRMAEVLAGALLAVAFPDDRRLQGSGMGRAFAWLGVPAFAGLLAAFTLVELSDAFVYRGGFLLHAALTCVVLAAVCVPGPLRTLLATPSLEFVGRISYGIYVYHWPVYLLVDAAATGLSPGPLFALRMALVGVLATVSQHFLEAPIRAGTRLPGRTAPLVGIAAILLIGVTALGGQRSVPDEFALDAVDEQIGDLAAPDAGGPRVPRVFVVGDSVARSVGIGLRVWGRQTGRAIVAQQGYPGCSVVRGGTRMLYLGPEGDRASRCALRQARWLEVVDRFRPDIVVMLTGGVDLSDRLLDDWDTYKSPGDPAFDAWMLGEYQRVVDELTHGGARLVWLTWPCAEKRVYHRVNAGDDAFSPERIAHLNQVIIPALVRSRKDRVRVVDLFGHVCPGGRFTHALGDFTEARKDGIHFSLEESRWLADWLGPEVLSAWDDAR